MTQLEQLYARIQCKNIPHAITFTKDKTHVIGHVCRRSLLNVGIKTMTLTFDTKGKCIDANYGTKEL